MYKIYNIYTRNGTVFESNNDILKMPLVTVYKWL